MASMYADYFMASTVPLSGSGITSNTVLFIPQWKGVDNAPKDVVCFVGSASGLETDIFSANGGGGSACTAANGCGVHVHSGTDCETSETQGGHWYNKEVLDVDPWALIGYEQTNSAGFGQFATCVYTGFDVASNPNLLDGRAFIVHREDGSRASCGLISKAPDGYKAGKFLEAKTVPIAGVEGTGTGHVQVLANVEESVTDGVCYIGYAKELEPNVESFLLGSGDQCNVKNGCGAHIHAGTSCENSETQGGHYYDAAEIAVDPWALESYLETDKKGSAAMVGCAITGNGAADYETRPFIIHKTDGSRFLCGLLEAYGTTCKTSIDCKKGAYCGHEGMCVPCTKKHNNKACRNEKRKQPKKTKQPKQTKQPKK